MINKVERGECSPTASLLGRLSGAFGLTISTLLARAELSEGTRLARAATQPRWQDPESGYIRRQVSPSSRPDFPLEIVHVDLPPGATVAFPASSYAFIRQLIWVLRGKLTFVEAGVAHELGAGDCLQLGPPSDCTYRNEGKTTCAYCVVVLRQ